MTTDIENTQSNCPFWSKAISEGERDQAEFCNADGHIFRAKKIVLGNPKHWNHVSLETYFFI